MCGIAGGVWLDQRQALTPQSLRRMTDVLRHRGPDDEGVYFSDLRNTASVSQTAGPHCALGFRRLSIIDLAGGHQPLSNEDGTVWIVFNGEIYNYRELRGPLQQKGHRFATASDTEVIVHLYEEHGLKFVHHLRGMFALAIWDERRRRLVLARDRIGQKPLSYKLEQGRLLFASELKALLQVPGASREIDPEGIDLFLTYQYVPHPRSILKGYAKLPPAHLAVYEQGQLSVSRYWQAPYAPDDAHAESTRWTPQQWSHKLRETLTKAVELRMRSDVPIGAFLSGGIDSTIISGLMQRLSPHPIHTFSIGFPIEAYDERQFAREAARHLGTDHHEFEVDPSTLNMLPKLIWHYDEPFGDSSAIPTMYLSQVTRQIVTVALSGDGGDELFAGYPRYQAVALARQFDMLPQWLRSVFAWNIWQRIPTSNRQGSLARRAKRFAAALAQTPERQYLRWIGIFDVEMRQQLYAPQFARQLAEFDSAQFLLAAYDECPSRDFVTRTTCADVHSYLPCDILTKVDIASMAYSLEARSPFLDHHVVELAARMPVELKFDPGRSKKILIDTFQDLIPEPLRHRPKMGFGVPIDHWFRSELKGLLEQSILSDRALSRGYFRPETVRRLVDEHVQGRWDHCYRLWNLVIFEQWQRLFVDGDVPIGPAP